MGGCLHARLSHTIKDSAMNCGQIFIDFIIQFFIYRTSTSIHILTLYISMVRAEANIFSKIVSI